MEAFSPCLCYQPGLKPSTKSKILNFYLFELCYYLESHILIVLIWQFFDHFWLILLNFPLGHQTSHCSSPSTLNFLVPFDSASENTVIVCWYIYHINPIKPCHMVWHLSPFETIILKHNDDLVTIILYTIVWQ